MTEGRDPTARREMANLMRKFARGGLTVDEFEREAELLRDRDLALVDAYLFAWHFYSDFGTDELPSEKRLSPDVRRLWAKWVLFLMTSEEEYSGPSLAPQIGPYIAYLLITAAVALKYPAAGVILVVAMVFGITNWLLGQLHRIVAARVAPLPDHWPFPSQEAYAKAVALENPFARSQA